MLQKLSNYLRFMLTAHRAYQVTAMGYCADLTILRYGVPALVMCAATDRQAFLLREKMQRIFFESVDESEVE